MSPTIIQMKAYDATVTYQLLRSDRTIDEILHGFVTCCLGLTFSEDQIKQAMKDYLDD